MKTLIKVGENAWLDPEAIDALVETTAGCLVILHSGEQVTLYAMNADDVLDRIQEALDPSGAPEDES